MATRTTSSSCGSIPQWSRSPSLQATRRAYFTWPSRQMVPPLSPLRLTRHCASGRSSRVATHPRRSRQLLTVRSSTREPFGKWIPQGKTFERSPFCRRHPHQPLLASHGSVLVARRGLSCAPCPGSLGHWVSRVRRPVGRHASVRIRGELVRGSCVKLLELCEKQHEWRTRDSHSVRPRLVLS